jgi:hypothetical protein
MSSLRVGAMSLLALAAAVVFTVPLYAQDELLKPKIISRPFPAFTYCPLPFDMSFTATGSGAVLRISTTTVNYSDENNGGEPTWSNQRVDNLCVVPDAVYNANLVTYTGECYFPHPEAQVASVFALQSVGALPLKETFDTDPASSGWDVAHNAYWDQTITAPNDPGPDSDFDPKGSLGLGAFDPALSLTDSAFTTRMVTGLTKGQVYHVTGWWYVGSMNLDKIELTVAVLGSTTTPVARTTWGMLKRKYQ